MNDIWNMLSNTAGGKEQVKVVPYEQDFSSGEYIDLISPKTFEKYNCIPGIIFGIDHSGRKFISFCFEQHVYTNYSKHEVITIFERYCGSSKLVMAGHYMDITKRLFFEDRYGAYSSKAMNDETYCKWYPLETNVGEGLVILLKELIDNDFVLTKDTFLPPTMHLAKPITRESDVKA